MDKILHLEVFTGKVDRENCIIRGVPLISVGTAKGHDMDIDSVTLSQALSLIPATGLKAKINHRDSTGVRSINGRFHSPRMEGSTLRADWHLLKTHADTPWILEMADKQPEDCGISLSCKAGTQVAASGRKVMRIQTLKSADLVDDPAATDSLLEALPVDTESEDMKIEELAELVKKTNETVTNLSTKVEGLATFQTELSKVLGKDADEEPENKQLAAVTKTLTELSTKFETMAETLKTAGQKPAATGATDTNLSADGGKTAEEKILEGKLKDAKTKLEASFGIAKVELASKYEKDFGPHWKTRLVELEAKQ